ncbi:ATP/maltotriose-dependent transcriptional regulator MalT [Mycobacterium sp. OAS707]|uniref:ATP-binding protein n=1 Tax=Mycobacterium sp. OAS707 TaxID=2663822 RepID=UPI0019E58418|nr:ATP/maltotriose-dependent transcriptional regulator MalT [Mycobacterium sp. OAS707]
MNRFGKLAAVGDFLTEASAQPSCLVVDGEAGIGKTTLWLAAIAQARERGFRVLSAQAGQAESWLAYAAAADLVGEIEASVLDQLPEVQRVALDRVLLRSDLSGGMPCDQRVVATAFLSVVEGLAHTTPVLVAIDDVQWLDPSSKAILAFVARRLTGRVGVLVTERSQRGVETATSWLRLRRPDGVERIRVRPLSLGRLRDLFDEKLGRSFPRPTIVRIAEISGGNPYFALELARTMLTGSPSEESDLPATLADLVRARIGRLDTQAQEMLLATACSAEPTVDLLARATGNSIEQTVELLEEAESEDIIGIDGNHVQFSHPLLARGVYTDATPSRRRAMHRALADVEALPELKAKHLALATTNTDPVTLRALDEGADAARARGAPAAAAELVESAIRLGGDTPSRRLRAADHYFQAGDNKRARALLEPTISQLEPGPQRATALTLSAEMLIADGSFEQAVDLLWTALSDAADDHPLLVQILLLLSNSLIATCEYDESLHHTRQAVVLAEELGNPMLSSQALAMWVKVSCMCGQGVDELSLSRALELEDPELDVPYPMRASTAYALTLAWTGRLAEARRQMYEVRRHCIERGAEGLLMDLSLHCALIEIWRGSFVDAAQIATDAMERAEQLGGDQMLAVAMAIQSAVDAYAGHDEEARAHARTALEAAERCGARSLTQWPAVTLGFLEVSLGNYAEALAALEPLLSEFDAIPGTEIITASFLPDAIEAMIAVGRLDDAELLIDALEHNGQWLDRPWMLAVGARCRSMWLAAHGDVAAADQMAQQALHEHERLAMPFERARTQLLRGQLLRRQRRKDLAAAALHEALDAFEEMGTPLWAERVQAEIARTRVSATHDLGLTPSELRVAELAASGMTNRDVAATLFISPKTVEHNLARAYRKLGIHSRAELGQQISQLNLGESTDSHSAGGH